MNDRSFTFNAREAGNCSSQQNRSRVQREPETARRVRAAALKLFARSGYAAVSIREIASEVGVQPGALYNHFPTKQHILKDLMLSHLADLLAAWDEDSKAQGPETDPLDAFVRFHIRYHLEKADEVFIAYMELRNLEPENFAEVEAVRRTYEEILTRILTEGAGKGRYSVANPRVTTRAIIAMLTGIPTWYRKAGTVKRSDIETLYLTMVRKCVAPDTAQNLRETG
jgi:AcrR family transcriptional regulator